MGQILHGSARTTEAVRRAIQLRQESVRAAAKRYGVSPTTIQKWRDRETSMLDIVLGADATEDVREGMGILLTVGELNAVVGQDNVDAIGHCQDQSLFEILKSMT